MKLLLLLFVILLPSLSPSLLQVISVYRHGAREPIYEYYNANTFFDKGQLTSVGMRQHYNLGKELRSIYIDKLKFLSPNYSPQEFFVRSTFVNRTVVSAISQLSGLYPMGTGPKLPKKLNKNLTLPPFEGISAKRVKRAEFGLPRGFQPIPILTTPSEDDFLLLAYDPYTCPVFEQLNRAQTQTRYYKNMSARFEKNFREIERVLNMSYGSVGVQEAADIYDVFQNNIWAGGELPKLTKETLWAMEFVYNQALYFVLYGTEEERRIANTPFFEELVSSFDDKILALAENRTSYKWKMFSAHDTTVSMITTGLNLTSYECVAKLLEQKRMGIDISKEDDCFLFPQYASNLIFELHQENNLHYVKIKYNGKYVKICGNKDRKCRYEEFKKRLVNFKVDDFKNKCFGMKEGGKRFLEKKLMSKWKNN